MSSEEQPVREHEGSQPRVERGDEPSALDPMSGRDVQEDEYVGPDPERADDPPVTEEDQGV